MPRKTLPKDGTQEIGVKGELSTVAAQISAKFQSEEKRVDDLTIFDYRRMRDNDGQVQMLLNAIYNTILSRGVDIEEGEEWEGEEDSPEKQFIQDNLLQSPWSGGMQTEMQKVNKYKFWFKKLSSIKGKKD